MLSPVNIHMNKIIQIEQLIFRSIYVHRHTYMKAIKINKIDAINLKESKWEYMGEFRGRKGENVIIS